MRDRNPRLDLLLYLPHQRQERLMIYRLIIIMQLNVHLLNHFANISQEADYQHSFFRSYHVNTYKSRTWKNPVYHLLHFIWQSNLTMDSLEILIPRKKPGYYCLFVCFKYSHMFSLPTMTGAHPWRASEAALHCSALAFPSVSLLFPPLYTPSNYTF